MPPVAEAHTASEAVRNWFGSEVRPIPPVAEAICQSWEFDPWALALILILGVIYVCGWRRVHRQMPHRFGAARLAAFLAGLAALFLAIASPLHAYADLLLTAHMLQHLLLMLIVPPLLLAGAPYQPLLRGLPRRVVKHGLGPCLAWPALWRWGRRLTHPLTAWLAFVVTSTAWHVPALYELALRAPGWHAVEHLCFVATALLFWWPVLQPWPSRPQGSRWVLIPYLFLADVQNTILAAFLTFCERVLYPTYATAPRLTAMTALDDQAAAGAIMWVLGSVAFLIPAACVTIQVLQGPRVAVRPVSGAVGAATARVRGQVSAATPWPCVRASWHSVSLRPISIARCAVHQWVKRRAVRRGKATRLC
jgi:cytochrome c oxidase assembly factor CtaG